MEHSGKFYVIKFPNGQYFRAISAVGRVLYCESFNQAAKLFDFDLHPGEAQEMAAKFGGSLEAFTYQKDRDAKASVARLSFK